MTKSELERRVRELEVRVFLLEAQLKTNNIIEYEQNLIKIEDSKPAKGKRL